MAALGPRPPDRSRLRRALRHHRLLANKRLAHASKNTFTTALQPGAASYHPDCMPRRRRTLSPRRRLLSRQGKSMSLDWVKISLRGWRSGAVTGTEFFERLGLKPEDGFPAEPGDRLGKTAKLILALAEEQRENGCAKQIEEQLPRAAQWLNSRPAGVFD